MYWYNLLDLVSSHLGCCTPSGASIHRVLLCGKPGTGKSSWAQYALDSKVVRVTLTRDSGPEELLGSYTLKGGDTLWIDGPAITAWRKGCVLVIDEIEKASPSVHSILQALLDDTAVASITLATGEVITPQNGFVCIATSNEPPTALFEALLDRFEIVLAHCNQPVPAVFERVDDPALRQAVQARYTAEMPQLWQATLSIRRGIAITSLQQFLTPDESLELTCGDGAREIASVLASYQK